MTAPRELPSADILCEWFVYDPSTGILSWKRSPHGRIAIGSEVGMIDKKNGYRRLLFRRRDLMSHRIIWKLITGNDPIGEIDHINGNKSDNRWCNLRQATKSQNAMNRGLSVRNTSGHKGVFLFKSNGTWGASICINSRKLFLSAYKSKDDAIRARQEAERKLFGEFSRVVS